MFGLIIEEIPINPQEKPAASPEIPTDILEIHEDIKETPPNKRGRPAGAKNKAKPRPEPAPKPKANTKKRIEYDEEESISGEEEDIPPPRRSRRESVHPPDLDRHALAADVLTILQQQRYDRTNARRSHYASWFQNM